MRQFRFLVVLITIVSLSESANLQACGDKLLSIGKAVRLHPTASFLLYRSQSSPKTSAVGDPSLTGLLRHDGHTLHFAETLDQLTQALNKYKIDVVLVDPSDEPTLRSYIESAPSRAQLFVLPPLRVPRERYIAAIETILTAKHK
jgi:hypothetical protein